METDKKYSFRYIDAENGVMWIIPPDMTFAEFKAGGWRRCHRFEIY